MSKHFLTITEDPEFGRDCEVEHLPDCPTAYNQLYQCVEWICAIGWYLNEAGLPDEMIMLPPGKYPIEFWVESKRNYTGVMENEYGLVLSS